MEQNSMDHVQGVSAEQISAPAQITSASPEQAQPKSGKKNKKPLIIIAAAALVCSGLGGFFLYRHFSDDDSDGGKRKGSKKDDSAVEDLLDITDYDADADEPVAENLYNDGPAESEYTQLGISYDENGDFQMLCGAFDEKVSADYEALEFIDSYADQIGIDDAFDELSYVSENTYRNCTYYKFQQVYDDVPVYGNQLIVAVNKDGVVDSVCGGYTPVDVSTDPSIDQEKAEEIASKHIGDKAEIISDELTIRPYTDSGCAKLVYDIRVASRSKSSELFIDAESGDIIIENDLTDGAFETVNANFDGKIYEVDLEKSSLLSAGDYNLKDSERNITVFDGYGLTVASVAINSEFRPNILDELPYDSPIYVRKDAEQPDGSINISAVQMSVNPASSGDLSIERTPEENKLFTEISIGALSSVQNAYDYYDNVLGWKSIDGNGMSLRLFAGVYDTDASDFNFEAFIPNEYYYPGACYIAGAELFGVEFESNTFCFGALDSMPMTGKGIVAHEYTHGVVDKTARISDDPKSKTINEGYADSMGAIISGDWNFIKNEIPSDKKYDKLIRNAADPNMYDYPDKVGGDFYDDNPADEHKNATIVSHSAYLMSQNGIPDEKIARVYLNSLFRLSSTPDFEETARALLYSSVDLGYTREESKAIAKALKETRMLPPSGTMTITVHCGSHPIPDATVMRNGVEAGRTDENGVIKVDYDPNDEGGTSFTVRADGFKELTVDGMSWVDEEKLDFNLAVDEDFGSAHGSGAAISDGSTGEKVKVTILQMDANGESSHSKSKAQDYYVQKGARISLKKLVDAINKSMEKINSKSKKDPKLQGFMDIKITTDGTKIYFDTGYVPIEMSYVIYGTDEVFDFSKPINEDVVIEPRVSIGDFGFGSFDFDQDDLNDLADTLDGMFNS